MKRESSPIEYRTFDMISLRADGEEAKQIIGHAAMFNVIGDGGWFREKIAPGAFAKSIERDDVRALFNHDKNFPLGRNKAGTLRLSEDDKGLLSEIDPPDTQYARDLLVSIGRGDITQMSFGFEIVAEERIKGQGKEPDLFIIKEAKLWDVSPVTFPFYTQTDVSVHSREAWAADQRKAQIPAGLRAALLRREFTLRYFNI